MTSLLVYDFIFFFPLAGFVVVEADKKTQQQEEYNCHKWSKIIVVHHCLPKRSVIINDVTNPWVEKYV